jgi:16S rRNA (cytosine967-C5)-methyltransferase
MISPWSDTVNPRATAARIIDQVCRQGRSLSQALDGARLVPRDRPLVQEMCYGTLRTYPRLSLVVDSLLQKPLKAGDGDVRALLLLGLYQLTAMRVPAHAAVSETVAATNALKKPWARGLVNGVLRNFQRNSDTLLAQAESNEEGRWLHPAWLIGKIRKAWPDDWQVILSANNQRPPMSLRVNQAQNSVADYLGQLAAAGLEAHASAQVPGAIVLEQATDVENLPGFRQGRVSVQDEAAQLAASLLDLVPGQRVLDVCAAPGGKTGHILEGAAVDLVAVDVDADRLQRVAENLRRLGYAAQLIAGDATRPADWWDGRPFDRILLDAPCSATGVIRRHPDIKLLRRPEDIQTLVELQARILDAVWPLLKPGGMLLYATCSVLPAENAGQVDAFLARRADAVVREIAAAWGRPAGAGRQILPGVATNGEGMDGFYYACLEKRA